MRGRRSFTKKVAAANSLRTSRLIKKKLEDIAYNFGNLDQYISNMAEDAILEIERLEAAMECVRQEKSEKEW